MGWTLATRRRSGRLRRAETRSPGGNNVVTVYVDNLSEDMDAEWLGQIFSKYGAVVDVFIPKKRSKRYLSKFGFVRFSFKWEAEEAITSLNGIIIREKKMLVKMATYGSFSGRGGVERANRFSIASSNNQLTRAGKDKEVVKETDKGFNLVQTNRVVGKSFAEAVKGKLEPRRIIIKECANEWVSRSVVAKL